MKKYIFLSTIVLFLLGILLLRVTQSAPEARCTELKAKEAQQECFASYFSQRAITTNSLGLCTKAGTEQKKCVQTILQAQGAQQKTLSPCDKLENPGEKKHCRTSIVSTLNGNAQSKEYCTLLNDEEKNGIQECDKTEVVQEETPAVKTASPQEQRVVVEQELLNTLKKTGNITFCAQIGDSELQITCATEILTKFPAEKEREVSKQMKEAFCQLEGKAFTEEQKKALEAHPSLSTLCRLL